VPEEAPQPGKATHQIRRRRVGGGEKRFDFYFGPELIADPVVALFLVGRRRGAAPSSAQSTPQLAQAAGLADGALFPAGLRSQLIDVN